MNTSMNTIVKIQYIDTRPINQYNVSRVQRRLVYNHNQTLVRAHKTRGLNYNHNVTLRQMPGQQQHTLDPNQTLVRVYRTRGMGYNQNETVIRS
ncbi:MAG: hypothetical protein R3E79_35270 [Caldilineaceae bacterium]